MSMAIQRYDAIVIGGGGAGQRAALQLAQSGHNVAMVSKVFPTRSHTVSAQGGINAALGNMGEDDWRWHMFDTINGSDYLGDQEAIEYMCENAPATVIELEHMGLPFSRNENGTIYQRAFGGQTLHYGGDLATRTCCAADRTGHAMLHTLYQKNVEAKTRVLSEWYAVDLVKSRSGGIAGAIAICMETGEVIFLHAKATVLATGGAGQIFATTTNAYTNTGDGLGLALRAGLPVQDMEMWQFHPTGIYGPGCLISEGVRGEGGYLLNKDGERYMERYAPHLKDLSCRDIVSRASMTEVREGRGVGAKGDHVLLKLDHLGAEVIETRLPGIREMAKTFAGVDPIAEPIPVLPTCHYMMGGVPTNIYGQVLTQKNNMLRSEDVIVEGLYASGECACVSVHGANRLGANSLLDIIVFGRAVGLHLNEALNKELALPDVDPDDIEEAQERLRRWETNSDGEDIATIRHDLQQVMSEDFGVFRQGETMSSGLLKLQEIRERVQNAVLRDKSNVFNMERIEALELDNLMDTALASAVCANNRTESRGAHSRMDYPDRDDSKWLKHSLYYADGTISYRSINLKPKNMEPFPVKERVE